VAEPTVLTRLRREGIMFARDLAGLDKEDLRELGFSMLERSRVLRWSSCTRAGSTLDRTSTFDVIDEDEISPGGALSEISHTEGHSDGGDGNSPSRNRRQRSKDSALVKGPRTTDAPACSPSSSLSRTSEVWGTAGKAPTASQPTGTADAANTKPEEGAASNGRDPTSQPQAQTDDMPPITHSSHGHRRTLAKLEARIPMENLSEDQVQRRLDEVEQRADFWCSIVTSATPPPPKMVSKPGAQDDDEKVSDLRENILEELFDLSRERIETLYSNMVKCSRSERDTLEALRQGLQRCGLPRLSNEVLEKIMKVISAEETPNLGIAEFEAILSRLKLAQLLSGSCRLPLGKDHIGGQRVVLGQHVIKGSAHPFAAESLMVVDYGPQGAAIKYVSKAKHREFFFGHRKRPPLEHDLPLVRWVHMNGLDLNLLLALTVKYGLHPLCVEDVIEQCPSKIDRCGCHYFAAVEQLCLVSTPDGTEPVKVHGRHVAIFCSGPPLFDTLVTVTEPDHDEKEDWPGGPVRDTVGAGEAWVTRLRQRLSSPHSRLRERRADFLMHQIIDVSADELVKVTKAYTTRLHVLEGQPHITSSGIDGRWMEEVSLMELQLQVVGRRLKGLQRTIRRVTEDPDLLPSSTSYITDVKDHIDEAHEDAMYLVAKCKMLLEESERAVDEHQRKTRERAADELNRRVFALTVATAIFSPMHFTCGVYGMNFVNAQGTPTIPELLWPHGYLYFWMLMITYLVGSSGFAIWFWRRLQRQAEADLRMIGEDMDGGKKFNTRFSAKSKGVQGFPRAAGPSSANINGAIGTLPAGLIPPPSSVLNGSLSGSPSGSSAVSPIGSPKRVGSPKSTTVVKFSL